MQKRNCRQHPEVRDYGREPFIFNIDHATTKNENFRTTLWTGKYMQLTLMSIPVYGDIGAEMHSDVDQFIRVESGRAKVYMGNCQNSLDEEFFIDDNYAIIIPAGTWNNIENAGNRPLKLYSLYAPPAHPYGTVHRTKADSEHIQYGMNSLELTSALTALANAIACNLTADQITLLASILVQLGDTLSTITAIENLQLNKSENEC